MLGFQTEYTTLFLQDFLSPWEQQLAEQINALNLPVHVEVRLLGGS
jgi:hypothetical protein